MTIHLYALSWNEMRMLGFFFRHYAPWVDRFVFFDDGSDDGTIEFLQARPNVELRKLPRRHADSIVDSARVLFNECWKESRGIADWVVIVDIDEHLQHADILGYLETCRRQGVTIVPALGYQMMTDEFPRADEYLATTRTRGAPSGPMSKPRIFDPAAIAEINFAVGGHTAKPQGRVVYPERDELLLLHYKYLGPEYAFERNRFLSRGLRERDREQGWGQRYFWERAAYEQYQAELAARLIDLSDPSYQPGRDHGLPRWWRT